MMFCCNLLFLAAAAAVFAACIRRNPQSFFPASSLIFFLLWQGVSVAYLETGKYSFELFTATYQTWGTLRLALALCALFAAYWAGFGYFTKKVKPPEPGIARGHQIPLVLFVAALSLSLLWLYLILLPSTPELNSRNLYIASTTFPARDLIFKYLTVMAFGAGLAAALSVFKPLTYAAYLSALGCVFIMTKFGHKFSGILDVLFPFYIPLAAAAIHSYKDKIYLRRHLILMSSLLLFSAALSINTFSKYLNLRQEGWEDLNPALKTETADARARDYLKVRLLVLQGGLWWITDRNAVRSGQRYTYGEMRDYARKMPYKTLAPSNAYLTEKAIGREKNRYLLERYEQYASAAPAVFYAYAGTCGPQISYAAAGLLFGLLSFYLTRKILLAHPLRAVLAFMLYTPVYNFILGGEPAAASPKNLSLKILLLLALEAAHELTLRFRGRAT